jgi:hypothetical protein
MRRWPSEMRTYSVAAVAGVDPGRVGQPVEDLGDDLGVQRVEPRRVLLRVPDAAGEQAITGRLLAIDDVLSRRRHPRGPR